VKSFNDLLDIGLNVDVGGLRDALQSMDERIEEIKDGNGVSQADHEELAQRVDALENQDGTIEDKVNEILGNTNVEDLASRVQHLENLNTCGKDINNLVDESEVENIIDNHDFQTESDVDRLITNYGYQDAEDVQQAIDSALSDYDPDVDTLDEDDVRRIAEEVISESDNALVNELETRVDRYSQRVDALIGGAQGMGTDVATLQARVITLESTVMRLVQDNAHLQARVDNHGVIADLLRDVARKILGLG